MHGPFGLFQGIAASLLINFYAVFRFEFSNKLGSGLFPGTALWALLPLIARSRLGCGAAQFGFLMACLGAGAVVAAVALPAWRRRWSADELVVGASLLFSAAQLGIVPPVRSA